MKCVQNTENGKVLRVSDQHAADYVATRRWKYVPRKVWKEQVRDAK